MTDEDRHGFEVGFQSQDEALKQAQECLTQAVDAVATLFDFVRRDKDMNLSGNRRKFLKVARLAEDAEGLMMEAHTIIGQLLCGAQPDEEDDGEQRP